MTRYAIVNGRLVPGSRPALRLDDRGFAYGDGAFETLRALRGVPVGLGRHHARLAATLDHLDIPAAPWLAALPAQIGRLLAANGLQRGEACVRVRVSRGAGARPTVALTAAALPRSVRERRRGVVLAVVPAAPGPLAAHKTLCYLPWVLARRAVGGLEPLAVDAGGHVLESATANVFCVVDGALWTPPADGRLLPGTARSVLLEAAARRGLPVRLDPLPLTVLLGATEAFVSNALLRAAPLTRVDAHALPRGPGPVLRALLEDFDEIAGA